jgi:hypothetical protein
MIVAVHPPTARTESLPVEDTAGEYAIDEAARAVDAELSRATS